MSDDPTPTKMLREYRLHAHEFNRQQIALFNELSLKERLELLFHMSLNNNAILQHLHNKIEPGQAEIQSMVDAETKIK